MQPAVVPARYLRHVDTRIEYFVADRGLAMTLAERGPDGTDLPMALMTWAEPWVLGSQLWGIIEDLPAPEGSLPFDPEEHNAGGEVLPSAEEGFHGVVQIADGFVRALAALPDERVPAVAERWATSDEWSAAWEPGALDSTVEGLRDLARRVKRGQHLYMRWRR